MGAESRHSVGLPSTQCFSGTRAESVPKMEDSSTSRSRLLSDMKQDFEMEKNKKVDFSRKSSSIADVAEKEIKKRSKVPSQKVWPQDPRCPR